MLALAIASGNHNTTTGVSKRAPNCNLLNVGRHVRSTKNSLRTNPRLNKNFRIVTALPCNNGRPTASRANRRCTSRRSRSYGAATVSDGTGLSSRTVTSRATIGVSTQVPSRPSRRARRAGRPANHSRHSGTLRRLHVATPGLRSLLASLGLGSMRLTGASGSQKLG